MSQSSVMSETAAMDGGRVRSRHAQLLRALMAILSLSVVLRIGAAFFMGDAVLPLPGVFDQVSYDTLARRVLDGHGLTFPRLWWPFTPADAPTAHWSYLYTGYLTVIYSLSGGSALVARLFQAIVVGLLHPWLTYRLGRRLFGERAALLAALSVAIYIYFIYYTGALMTESFYIVTILWTLDVAQRIEVRSRSGRVGRRLWAELGAALAITTLLRQLFLLFAPIVALWLLYRLGGRVLWRARVTGVTLTATIVILSILPFTLYNYARFDSFVLLNTNAGFAFFWGNHPIYGSNFEGILPDDGPVYQELVPEELRDLSEPALERALLRRGIQFVIDDPVRYVLLSISRIQEYFKFWPSSDSSLVSNLSRLGSFALFLPLMLYGLWLSIRERADWGRRSGVGPELILLYMAFYTGIHLLTWTLIRYRLPVDATLLLFAGLALARLLTRARGGAGRAGAAPPVA